MIPSPSDAAAPLPLPGAQRPGGRTARTRRAAATAVRELIDAGRPVSFADVAARSGLNATTLWRRWSSPSALIIDALREDIEMYHRQGPAVRGVRDALRAYARDLAASVTSRRGQVYLGALAQAAADDRVPAVITDDVVRRRLVAYTELLEPWPDSGIMPSDLLDGLFAPLSLHALLDPSRLLDDEAVLQYVDNILRLAADRQARAGGA